MLIMFLNPLASTLPIASFLYQLGNQQAVCGAVVGLLELPEVPQTECLPE